MNARELFRHWDEVREGLCQALDKLTDAQLAFVPHEDLWSLGSVVCHIASGEEHWFRYYIAGKRPEGEGGYDLASYPTVSDLRDLLDAVHARTDAYLGTLNASDLDQEVSLPWCAKTTLRWVIWHVLEHEIHHRGEIFLMIGLLGMEAPDI